MSGRANPSFHHSAGGIVFIDRQILLISTSKATRWQLPKGHVERGESPAQAAVREIREETGVSSHIVDELGALEYRYKSRYGRPVHKKVDYFLCSYVSGSTDDYDRREVSGAEWLDWPEALDRLTFANERDLAVKAHLLWRQRHAD